jgi:hypothetical protein
VIIGMSAVAGAAPESRLEEIHPPVPLAALGRHREADGRQATQIGRSAAAHHLSKADTEYGANKIRDYPFDAGIKLELQHTRLI